MSEFSEPVLGEDNFEASVRGEGGEIPMPSIGAESRNRAGTEEDQTRAVEQPGGDRRRVAEGYVRPGEPHTD